MRLYKLLLMFCFVLISCTQATPKASDAALVLGVKRGWLLLDDTYTIRADGTGEAATNLAIEVGSQPQWSFTREWIAYSTIYQVGKPEEAEIYLVESSGKNRTLITNNTDGGAFAPTWSPDGKEILYYAYSQGSIYRLNVECILNNTECNLIPLKLVQGRAPDWSPDGKQLVYESETLPGNIYVTNIDEPTTPLNVSKGLRNCHEPQWSPLGDQLVFRCDDGLYIVSHDGTDPILIETGTGSIQPDWTPDGNGIVFISARDGLGQMIGLEDTIRSTSVFMIDIASKEITRLSLRDDEFVAWFTWLPSNWD
jgi:TolB protein